MYSTFVELYPIYLSRVSNGAIELVIKHIHKFASVNMVVTSCQVVSSSSVVTQHYINVDYIFKVYCS